MSAVSIWEMRLKYRAHHPSGKRKSPFNPKGCPGSPGRLPTPGPHRSARALANAESYAVSERVRLTITAADTHSQGSPKIDTAVFAAHFGPAVVLQERLLPEVGAVVLRALEQVPAAAAAGTRGRGGIGRP